MTSALETYEIHELCTKTKISKLPKCKSKLPEAARHSLSTVHRSEMIRYHNFNWDSLFDVRDMRDSLFCRF